MDKDKSLNTKKIVSVAARAATVLAAAALFFFAGRGMTGDHDAEHTVDVLGHELGEYTTEISFSGDEISDLSALRGGLKKLHSLKRADLGSFHMSDALTASSPNVTRRRFSNSASSPSSAAKSISAPVRSCSSASAE